MILKGGFAIFDFMKTFILSRPPFQNGFLWEGRVEDRGIFDLLIYRLILQRKAFYICILYKNLEDTDFLRLIDCMLFAFV